MYNAVLPKSSYGFHGCPDKGANGMFSWAKSKGHGPGAIDTLPEIVGLALYKDGHAGYHVGGGYAVEWQVQVGLRQIRGEKHPWAHWYRLPFIDYGGGTVPIKPSDTPATEHTLGSRQPTIGSKGADVKALQEFLLQPGHSLPRYGADGEFGTEALNAVIAFQKKAGIPRCAIETF